MGLSEDQRALLRLLAQREEGYEDIGALMGLSTSEVRSRVRDALAELESDSTGVPAPPAPPETPRAVAPDPRPAPERPRPEPLATPPSSPKPAAEPKRRSGPALPKNRRRLAEIIGGALVVLLLILFATGAIDLGGDDDSDSDGAGQATAISPTSTSKTPTKAVLEGVDGSDAEGEAVFGRLREQVLLVLGAKGLPPSPAGRSYAISLVRSPTERIPIAATKVGKDGLISGQFTVPATALGLLASGFDELEVSLVANSDLREAVLAAQKQGSTPTFEGIDVLRGEVVGPVVEAGGES